MTAITANYKLRLLTLSLATLGLGASATNWAQTSGPIAPRPGQAVQQPPQGASQKPLDQSIRVRVNLVNAPVIVRDAKGELVLDLVENNFRIFDNGIEQRLEAFDMGSGPLSVVIVMESSSRIQALMPALRRTGVLFTETVMGENGDGAVIGYDDEINHLQNFTSDHDAIDKCIAGLKPGTSGARLYDALGSAESMLEKRREARTGAAGRAVGEHHDLFRRPLIHRSRAPWPAEERLTVFGHAARRFWTSANTRHTPNADYGRTAERQYRPDGPGRLDRAACRSDGETAAARGGHSSHRRTLPVHRQRCFD
jgi:hypothetical protein